MIYFKLWVLYFHIKNPCATCYQSHSGNGISKLENLWEISRNPSPISRFPSPKIRFSSPKFRFSSYETRFTKIGFLLSFSAFRFLQRLSSFSNGFLIFFNGFPLSPTAFRFLPNFSNGFPIFLNGFPLSEKSEKIYLWREVYEISLFELRIFRHSLPEIRNSR